MSHLLYFEIKVLVEDEITASFLSFIPHRGKKVSQWIKTFDRGYVRQANKRDKYVR